LHKEMHIWKIFVFEMAPVLLQPVIFS